jgi:hypothetical protein
VRSLFLHTKMSPHVLLHAKMQSEWWGCVKKPEYTYLRSICKATPTSRICSLSTACINPLKNVSATNFAVGLLLTKCGGNSNLFGHANLCSYILGTICSMSESLINKSVCLNATNSLPDNHYSSPGTSPVSWQCIDAARPFQGINMGPMKDMPSWYQKEGDILVNFTSSHLGRRFGPPPNLQSSYHDRFGQNAVRHSIVYSLPW